MKKWHVANWTALGWLETIIKLAAHAVALVALVNALSAPAAALLEGARLLQVIIMGLLALGLTGAIIERFMQREIIAMIFVLINNVAHWGMVYALTRSPGPGNLLLIFAGLMLLGDLVKIGFFLTTPFIAETYGSFPRWLPYALTGFFIAGYIALIVLGLAAPPV